MSDRISTFFLGTVYISLYLVLGVFYVQMIDGLHLEIYGWPTELKSDLQYIIEMLVPVTLSLTYLYAFNIFIIRLNHLKLGAAFGISALMYTYIINRGPDAFVHLTIVLFDYPHNIIFALLVILPILLGFALNKRRLLGRAFSAPQL